MSLFEIIYLNLLDYRLNCLALLLKKNPEDCRLYIKAYCPKNISANFIQNYLLIFNHSFTIIY